ncbi:hypothetical protein HK101_001897 [Irineochytrium annulatum]|nr:hypothetical protein HK101_001897 [Irineochytrium annulatum]
MGLSSLISLVACLWNPNLAGLAVWKISDAPSLSPAAVDSELLQCLRSCDSGAMVLAPDVSSPQTAFLCYCYPDGIDAILRSAPTNASCGKLCGGTDASFTCGGLQGGVVEASVYTILGSTTPASSSRSPSSRTPEPSTAKPSTSLTVSQTGRSNTSTIFTATATVASSLQLSTLDPQSFPALIPSSPPAVAATFTSAANGSSSAISTAGGDQRVVWAVVGASLVFLLAVGILALHRARNPRRGSPAGASFSAHASTGSTGLASVAVTKPSENFNMQPVVTPPPRAGDLTEWSTAAGAGAATVRAPQRKRSIASMHSLASDSGALTARRGSVAATAVVISPPMSDAALLDSMGSRVSGDWGEPVAGNLSRRGSTVSRQGSNASLRMGYYGEAVPPVPAVPPSLVTRSASIGFGVGGVLSPGGDGQLRAVQAFANGWGEDVVAGELADRRG